jgi:hypothetical protein
MTRVLLINPPSPEHLGAPLLGMQYGLTKRPKGVAMSQQRPIGSAAFLAGLAAFSLMTACATDEQGGTPGQQAAQSGDDVGTRGLAPACCTVIAIDAKSGVVTARRSDGSAFQFRVADARLLATLKIGQAVWLDARGAVSLEGAPNCCKLLASQVPVPGAVGLGVSVSPLIIAQLPIAQRLPYFAYPLANPTGSRRRLPHRGP